MTPAAPQAKPRSAWWRWRHDRPFWGGLLVTLAGAEILLTVQAPLPVVVHVGMQGLAVLVNAADVDKSAEDARNNLLVMKPKTSFPVSYWAGFAWDRAGQITSADEWKKYVDEFGERLRSPIEVTVK